MTKRYLFLISWHADSLWGDYGIGVSARQPVSEIRTPEELLDAYYDGNNTILAIDILADNIWLATLLGQAQAFQRNYTAANTVSLCIEVKDVIAIPQGQS